MRNTVYIRDASGNVMNTYETTNTASLALAEQYLYGSSRLGVLDRKGRSYELTDHLGNVLAVVDEFKEVRAAYEYYAFGMSLAKVDNGYRYGFNGYEKDPEIGQGQHIGFADYGYDPLTARRWNVDPKGQKHPQFSPYNAFGNSPVMYVDKNGQENVIYIAADKNGKPEIDNETAQKIKEQANIVLKDYIKVNTRVEIISPNTVVETTDNVVVIGKDRGNIQAKMAEYNRDLANSDKMKDWVTGNDPTNPEFGDNDITKHQIGGVVDLDAIKPGLESQIGTNAFNKKITPDIQFPALENVKNTDNNLLAGLFLIHASGHAAQIGHPQYSNTMEEGRSWAPDFYPGNNNGKVDYYLKENRGKLSETEKTAWDAKYTTNKATELSKTGRRANPRKEIDKKK